MSSSPFQAGPNRIRFDYIKANFFRTARADGATCGLNGHGDIILNFYSERPPIPQRTVHRIEDGRLGDEVQEERMQRDAVVREVEISLSMNLQTAHSLRRLLDRQIEQLEKIIKEQQGEHA